MLKVHPDGPNCCEECKKLIGLIAQQILEHEDQRVLDEFMKRYPFPPAPTP